MSTAGRDPVTEHCDSLGFDSTEEKNQSIFYNWDEYGADDVTLVRQLYNAAIKEILDSLGGFPEVSLKNIPNYRTSKQQILRRVPKTNELQMVPKLPPNLQVEQSGEDFDKSKISAGYLDAKK